MASEAAPLSVFGVDLTSSILGGYGYDSFTRMIVGLTCCTHRLDAAPRSRTHAKD